MSKILFKKFKFEHKN